MSELTPQENIPPRKPAGLAHLITELRQRNVFKVAAGYALTGWLIIQLVNAIFPVFDFPRWTIQFVILLVFIGFPIALILAWAFERTPEGMKHSSEVEPDESIANQTGKKLNTYIIATLGTLVVFMLVERVFFAGSSSVPGLAVSSVQPAASATDLDPALPLGERTITRDVAEVELAPLDGVSLAILPFANLSSDPEQEYFADGLTEELINTLAEVDGLLVTGRTSAFYFKNSARPLDEIATMLGVSNLVQGSVRKSGTQLRIAVQLIAIDSGFTLWTQTFNRQLDDIFVIQDEIAEAVTTALSVTLGAGSFDRPGMTRNVEAYDAFLRAQKLGMEYSILDSIVQAERAVSIDPEFAVGWLEVADAYSQALFYLPVDQTSGYAEKRDGASARAEALAPDMKSFLFRKVGALRGARDYVGAERLLEQFIDTYSQDAEFYTAYAALMLQVGRYEEGIRWGERARRINPLSAEPANMLGRNLVNSSRSPDIARSELVRGIALGGSVPVFSANLAFVEMAQGDWQAALAATQNMVATKEVQSRMLQYLIDDRVQDGLVELRTMIGDSSLQPALRGRHLPAFAALFGDPGLALAFLDSHANLPDMGLPFFSEVRRLPGFKTWVEEQGLLTYWRTSGNWADFCRPVGEDFECF